MANTPNNINEICRLSSRSYQKGDLYTENDVRIDGRYEGTICSKCHVVIGETAVITGQIVCENLDIYGKVEGNVYVKDTLSLKASASVKGDMAFNKVQIEIGADFVGACTKVSDEDYDKKVQASVPECMKPVRKQ